MSSDRRLVFGTYGFYALALWRVVRRQPPHQVLGAVIAAPYALFSYLSYTVTGQGRLYQYVLLVISTACVLLSCAMILPHHYCPANE
jgi:hypothetical protein